MSRQVAKLRTLCIRVAHLAVVTLIVFSALALNNPVVGYGQESWETTGLVDGQVRCAAVATGDSALVLAGGEYLHVSSDGGQSWTTFSQIPWVWCVTFGSSAAEAFAGSWGQGVFKSIDNGVTWTQYNGGLGNWVIKSICVTPGNDALVYACAEDGLYRSMDAGMSWSPIKSGVNASAVVVSPADTDVIYLGTWGGGTWKSGNGGSDWSLLDLPDAGCHGIALDSGDASILYAVFQGAGVWLSLDAGVRWTQIQPTFEGFAVAPDAVRPGFVYGLGGWTTPQRSGCYGSAGGWTDMDAGWAPGWFARHVAVNPNDATEVYACAGNFGLVRWIADTEAPDAPADLSASKAGSAISLAWTPSDSPECTGYWVYKRVGSNPYDPTPAFAVAGGATDTCLDGAVIAGDTYHYVVTAIDAAQNHSAPSNEASAEVEASYDLDVAYITRLPRDCRAYWVDYPDGVPILHPGTEDEKRWPEYGETVTFRAHVVNKGTAPTPPANCRWELNGTPIATSVVPEIAPGVEGNASVDWAWHVAGLDTDHTDQVLTFVADCDDQVAETFEQNNTLGVHLEGMSLSIYVDPAIYAAFNSRINLVGTTSFEDWIQAQIEAMNMNFARSDYPLAPDGCLERVWIDQIVVGSAPPESDRVSDGRWSFTGDPAYADWAADRVDGGLIHELMHQLGIIDLYQMPVSPAHNEVITPDGLPSGMGFGFARMGIMAGGDIYPHESGSGQYMPEYCSSHDSVGLNRNCGYRRGYYGEYMFDIPLYNHIRVLDSAGVPVPNAMIRVYQGGGGVMDGSPVASGTTDGDGRFLLPNRAPIQEMTTATGHTLRPNPFGAIDVVGANATLLIEMSRPGGDFDYRFMNMIDFNLAFWGGLTSEWNFEIASRLASADLPRITTLNGAIDPASVTLRWPAVAGTARYHVYRASTYYNQPDDPNHVYENWVFKPIGSTTENTFVDVTRYETCRYAVAPVAAAGTEGPLSNRVFAPNLLNPWSVGILPDNDRVVLDPQNGFAFLRQASSGTYISNTGSEHNHVELSRFIAIDSNLERMLISHPSDWYGGPHSVRVTNYEGDLDGLVDYGTWGAGPGQFKDLAGVAVDAASRIYVADGGNARIQILSAAGEFLAEFGEPGSGNGQFDDPQGLAVGPDLRIFVADRGNQRVQILSFSPGHSSISWLGELSGIELGEPTGVAIAPDGRMLVTDMARDSLEVFDADGSWQQTHTAVLPPYSGTLLDPTGVAVDHVGRVVVCDTGNRRMVEVLRLWPAGDVDYDGDVDLDDFSLFALCMSGPDDTTPPPGCDPGVFAASDTDDDGDVDLRDFAAVQVNFGG